MEIQVNHAVVKEFIKDAIDLKSKKSKESILRENLAHYLGKMFTEVPWWVRYHVRGSEAMVTFSETEIKKRGFVDNLVGLTAIEWEPDLLTKAKFDEGYNQVANYSASLVNAGHSPDLIIGILSDTVYWRAYRLKINDGVKIETLLGAEHVTLEEIDSLDLTVPNELNAKKLIGFLLRHFGREGSRPLNAETLAEDMGLGSPFCDKHISKLGKVVVAAFTGNPTYARLIKKLWQDFVAYLGDESSIGAFDLRTYIREMYILTLAKLICANVIEKKALLSDRPQLESILTGDFFHSRGLENLVEYDYFGWLNSSPHVAGLLPIAQAIQDDLRAYDFASAPVEDLFGEIMAQLARRSQRLLLGQEWTPAWLAKQVVQQVTSMLPEGEEPRLIDMSCGSGAMIIEATKITLNRLKVEGAIPDETSITRLTQTITGFDIDPLAVMLSKISWLMAARSWLEPFDGTFSISIPVYHADSLFAVTPLSKVVHEEMSESLHILHFAEHRVELPSFMVSSDHRSLFDSLLSRSLSVAMNNAKVKKVSLKAALFESILTSACDETGTVITKEDRPPLLTFLQQLIETLDSLHRDGRNGIWAFILRNSYRPGLVSGQFNGLVSNPPWLALSKIADNPYGQALRDRAEKFNIKPPGASHLHVELATTFLLHAVERYLEDDAVVGCILPATILNGLQHSPFLKGEYKNRRKPIQLSFERLWRVQKFTFKNQAIVLFGKKAEAAVIDTLPGAMVTATEQEERTFKKVIQRDRVAWTDNHTITDTNDLFMAVSFTQGADVMPRTSYFHKITPATGAGDRYHIAPYGLEDDGSDYRVKDAKKFKDFRITPRVVEGEYVFDVLLSSHLAAFDLAPSTKVFLPVIKDTTSGWQPVDATNVSAFPQTQAAFNEILAAYGGAKTLPDLFIDIDTVRHKLQAQMFPEESYLVVYGAGGGIPCSAYLKTSDYDIDKLIIDQTLYWHITNDKDDAIYLTGMLNSESIDMLITDFQPIGSFGRRHVHKLAPSIIPPYDREHPDHIAVVDATIALICEWEKKKPGITEQKIFSAGCNLAQRRRKVRKHIAELDSYQAYDEAVKELLGL
ncbi:hypothetical protein [Desulfopila sp. IMCC35008]|uniref:hypothetical protein n=1 Tax=Desulfopila sp. IMCC35008 TaxID=2653858 RepID=UPI0013D3E90F|nr:hypothetical protein [Desulfopila sp. IMCC35008]